MFPKAWQSWKQKTISRALFSTSFGVPSKGSLPPVSPHRTPSDRDAPFLEPSLIHPSKSPDRIPLTSSPAKPLWRGMPSSRAVLYTFPRVPSIGTPSKFPSQNSSRERRSTSRAPLHPSLRVCVQIAPLHFRKRGAYGERCLSPEPLLHNLHPSLKVPGM